MQTAHRDDFTLSHAAVLTVALELACKSWKIALQDDSHASPAIHTTNAEEADERLAQCAATIEATKIKWKLPEPVKVFVSYEAGQDGFWIARALRKLGYEVYVVDPSSIPVERKKRRAKTDRLDAKRLVSCLRGWLRGEKDRMRVVHEPSVWSEAVRQTSRERGQLQKEIGQHRDRIRKLLCTHGCWTTVDAKFAERLAAGEIRCHDGSPLPEQLRKRLERECARLALVTEQLKALEASMLADLPPEVAREVERLQRLRGVGAVGAFRLMLELFWRGFSNRRQVGACLGLVPQPYDSGESRVDQGIGKDGNNRLRALAIEMAWMWIRHQPNSELTRWFNERTGADGTPGKNKRGRRVMIVAVARRLMIALWRYRQDGVVPKGAEFKMAVGAA